MYFSEIQSNQWCVCVCVYLQIFCKQDGHDRYIKSVAARVIQRLQFKTTVLYVSISDNHTT